MVKTPHSGSQQVIDYVSTKSFFLLKRETGAWSETFGDYRKIAGVMVPFRTVENGPGPGTVAITVKRFRFD